MSKINTRSKFSRLAKGALAGASLLLVVGLAGCAAAADDTAKTDPNAPVAENGDGRIDSGESIGIPSTDADLITVACDISESGELSAVNAQQLVGFGQYMSYLVANPASIDPSSTITDAAKAQQLADGYTPLGQMIYEQTKAANIPLPADLKAGLDKVCAGDVFAIA
jgi:hypothetical protein